MRISFRPRIVITILFLVVFTAATVRGWEWPYIAKLMPVYVATIPGIVFCLVQLYRDLTAWEGRTGAKDHGLDMDEVFKGGLDPKTEAIRTLAFFGWFAGGALGIWLLGVIIALPLFVLLYMLVEGREKWMVTLLMCGGTFLFLWGLFNYLLDLRWPQGILLQ